MLAWRRGCNPRIMCHCDEHVEDNVGHTCTSSWSVIFHVMTCFTHLVERWNSTFKREISFSFHPKLTWILPFISEKNGARIRKATFCKLLITYYWNSNFLLSNRMIHARDRNVSRERCENIRSYNEANQFGGTYPRAIPWSLFLTWTITAPAIMFSAACVWISSTCGHSKSRSIANKFRTSIHTIHKL